MSIGQRSNSSTLTYYENIMQLDIPVMKLLIRCENPLTPMHYLMQL